MKLDEFVKLDKYLEQLAEEKKPEDARQQRMTGMVRNMEFFSLIPLILEKHSTMLVRDMLEVDATFAVVFEKGKGPSFKESVSLFLDAQDICNHTLYTKVRNVGLIDLENHEGFWVLLGT